MKYPVDDQITMSGQELAWVSYTLLRNTSTCSVLCIHDGEPILARGAISERIAEASSADETLKAIAAVRVLSLSGSVICSTMCFG